MLVFLFLNPFNHFRHSGRDIFCLKNFDTFTRTSVRVSKMNAVARAQLTVQMLTLIKEYVEWAWGKTDQSIGEKWNSFVVVLGTNLHPITYPPLCLHIHICTSIFLHIDIFKEICCIFYHFIFFSHSKGYTHTVPQTCPGWVKYI